MRDWIADKKIVIAVHEGMPVGAAYDLRRFLIDCNIEKLLFIAHPLTFENDFYKSSSRYEMHEHGKLRSEGSAFHWRLPDTFLYIKDTIYTLIWSTKSDNKYDLFVGIDPLNALAGIVLRFFDRTNKVVYCTIDYFTPRFENKILNAIYHSIDKFCVRYCDETWNLSSVMAKARETYNNMPRTLYNRQYTVPTGIWFYKAKRKPFDKINKKKVIFTGHLNPMQGVDLFLQAMPKIIKKIPDIELEIIGKGPEYENLQKQARDLKLEKYILFHGWINNRQQLEHLLSDAAVGLATFNTNIAGDKVRNADPAKLKDYALLGIPFITTSAIANPKEVMDMKYGIVIEYNKDQLAKAVIKLLEDERLLKEYRDNTLQFAKQYDNEKIFLTNLKRIFL
ncbi:MAG: glycosyltransferase [Candidatus Parcubacteria bacterium]|nr:glycosyltransferase [Candidatus Parcubacteria bacterium]